MQLQASLHLTYNGDFFLHVAIEYSFKFDYMYSSVLTLEEQEEDLASRKNVFAPQNCYIQFLTNKQIVHLSYKEASLFSSRKFNIFVVKIRYIIHLLSTLYCCWNFMIWYLVSDEL